MSVVNLLNFVMMSVVMLKVEYIQIQSIITMCIFRLRVIKSVSLC